MCHIDKTRVTRDLYVARSIMQATPRDQCAERIVLRATQLLRVQRALSASEAPQLHPSQPEIVIRPRLSDLFPETRGIHL